MAAAVLVSVVALSKDAMAQNATVTVGSQKQFIRGFGGMSHAAWIGDMTAAQRALAFGNGAKAAAAAGAIVFATPWNTRWLTRRHTDARALHSSLG